MRVVRPGGSDGRLIAAGGSAAGGISVPVPAGSYVLRVSDDGTKAGYVLSASYVKP